ncbi:MAG: hypothetical protein HY794_11565, partial [Desulfarculus sp.]|nr:hypothetical protein [Desulfarculus sp.]
TCDVRVVAADRLEARLDLVDRATTGLAGAVAGAAPREAVANQVEWKLVVGPGGARELTNNLTRLAPQDLETDGKLVRAKERRPLERDWAADPPGHLYYGARRRAWPVIHEKGLAAPPGGVLVLLATPEEALKLGRRRDHEALLITVQARKAAERGVLFSLLGGRLWLADRLPADCLLGPPVRDDQPQKKPQKPKPAPPPSGMPSLPSPEAMPGSFLLNTEDTQKPYKRKGLKKDIEWKKERRKDRRRGDK